MWLGSHLLLNICSKKEEYIIQPFIHSYTNYYKEEDKFAFITIPDECPKDYKTDIKMTCGDFVTLYKDYYCNLNFT